MTDYPEIMEAFEDSLAPVWAQGAADAWATSLEVADDAGVDPEAVFRDHPEVERFAPTTDAEFEWALRKRARSSAKADDLREHMNDELHKLRSMFERLIVEQERSVNLFTDMIERGIRAMEPDSKGKRTVKTVAGTVYTRTADHFIWPADDELVAWAKANLADAVRVKESPDKVLIKAHVKSTGEVPDGLVVESLTTVVIKGA